MESLVLIGTILSAHIFAWLTPGPIFALIIRNSLVYSRKTGIWTAVGIAFAAATHITYSVTGLSIIVSSSPTVFNTIKFLGVGYLTYPKAYQKDLLRRFIFDQQTEMFNDVEQESKAQQRSSVIL